MVISFVLFFPRGVLDEILNLIELVSEDFPSYSFRTFFLTLCQNIYMHEITTNFETGLTR